MPFKAVTTSILTHDRSPAQRVGRAFALVVSLVVVGIGEVTAIVKQAKVVAHLESRKV